MSPWGGQNDEIEALFFPPIVKRAHEQAQLHFTWSLFPINAKQLMIVTNIFIIDHMYVLLFTPPVVGSL